MATTTYLTTLAAKIDTLDKVDPNAPIAKVARRIAAALTSVAGDLEMAQDEIRSQVERERRYFDNVIAALDADQHAPGAYTAKISDMVQRREEIVAECRRLERIADTVIETLPE